MNVQLVIIFFTLVFIFSLASTYCLILLAKSKGILDIPGKRSSHVSPTPRGGGFSVVLAVTLCILWFVYDSGDQSNWAWFGATLFFVALVGFIDDIKGLSACLRACLYVLFSLIYIISAHGFDIATKIEVIQIILGALVLTWMINLYNFMDGADGVAGLQALIVAIPVTVILVFSKQFEIASLCLVIAASVLGFLVWNWAPAKIFMGDVGSCSLGFIFGCLMYQTHIDEIISIFFWLILMSMFLVDSTLTLLTRFLRGEKWYEAHCSHAYQRYLQLGNSHQKLAIGMLMVGIFYLWPLAYLMYHYPENKLHITAIVYISMSLLWYFVQNSYYKTLGND